ncbi:MAG: tRNA epoxyqueuosine(34) reductase QueG [Pseudomonadota bacterium]
MTTSISEPPAAQTAPSLPRATRGAHPPSPEALKQDLVAKALRLGFDAVRVASPDAIPEAPQRLRAFLEAGRHGEMGWMETRTRERAAPSALWQEVGAVVMLGQNYGPDYDPLAVLERPDKGAISVYAKGDDYHDVVKKRLKALGRWLHAASGAPLKVFVDTAPVMEKPLAEAAGLGWQGKHTNLVSREFGSWLFLGALYTAVPLPADAAERDHCGRCRRCLDICPTNAFPAPYQLDARACISYLTIEAKAQIPERYRAAMGNRIYGCDDCLAVCPWNKFAKTGREAKLAAREALRAPDLADLVQLDDAAFRTLFSKSPVKRIGRARFVRNVLVAIGNAGDARLLPDARARLDDEAPLVRGMAVWALGRLAEGEARRIAPQRLAQETDETVRDEWRRWLTEPEKGFDA